MPFKFEKLKVWTLTLEYTDVIYRIAVCLPRSEDFNLRSQMIRASTSVSLNIAEGSTGQTNDEQARFIGMAIRSLIETVACLHLIHRRNYLHDTQPLKDTYRKAELLVAKLHTMRKTLDPGTKWRRDELTNYLASGSNPFDSHGHEATT